MSIINAIYNELPTSTYVDEESGTVIVFYKFQGKTYGGVANLHPEDRDFFSVKVGRAIATSRAKINMLEDALDNVQQEVKIKKQLIMEVQNYGRKSMEESAAAPFYRNIEKAEKRAKSLAAAISKERRRLIEYLEGQETALSVVKAMRKDKAD